MVGNVREWVTDFFDETYFARSPVDNPSGPDKGQLRVVKGGGWFSGTVCNSVSERNGLTGNWSDFNVGFRCVKDITTIE